MLWGWDFFVIRSEICTGIHPYGWGVCRVEKILTPTAFASIRLSTKNYATNVTLPVYDRNIFAEVCHTGSVTLVVLSLIEATTECSIPIYIGTNSRLDLVKSTSTCVAYEAKSIYIHSNYSALLPCVVRNSWYFMGDHEAAVRITPVTKLGCHVSLTHPEWLSHLLV